MRVVAVKSTKLHLYEIRFDNEQSGTIDKTVWEHSGFGEGSEMDEGQWYRLCEMSERHRAKEKALYYLSLRDYGSGELVSKLRRTGIARRLCEETVDHLVQAGLIDDRRYAQMLANDMSARKHYPKRRVAMALREKGFSSEVIEAALLQLPEEEEQQALELLCKKRYNGAGDPAKRQKALAMLARYGFSFSVSKRALQRLEEQRMSEDEDGYV